MPPTNVRTGVLTALVFAALALPASAAPILTGSATIGFSGDIGMGPVSVTDVVAIGSGPEIQFLDGSNIGDNVLLDFEQLDLGDLAITYKIQGGGAPIPGHDGYRDNGMTSGAFTFSSLLFSPSTSILGIAVSLTDVIDPQNALATFGFTANSVTMANLQQFGILESGENTGFITVRLRTGDVPPPPDAPEPGTLALLGIGVLAGARRIARKR